MSLETLLALFLFAFTTSITPGPNNMMLFASGVNFGFRRTIPHMFGIGAGFFSLLIAVGLGLGALMQSVPLLYTVLKFAGGAYLLWIAWKIGTSRSLSEGEAAARPMTFLGAAAFQWVNPKAWVMAVTAMATYTDPAYYLPTVLMVGLVFAAVNVPSVSTWAGFGSALREWLSVPVRLKWFNITMAVLLVASLWPMLK
ncbi:MULTISPECIES: LysE family translocator [unclassified Rhizobium]|jgi:threonine/homoserine/homoserine lactone efflux protein|uniref:LysE family translocator n=1 Tax=unclassified Rhizobium TaxID=2613769 RepID=UPI000629DFC3|nr:MULTISPECIES: LysE family translocator [unclassified Rhizobium]KKX34096.1 lysine transporter LysE [Rhizobium sp. LC145]OHV76573.1 lysine transporter LysE [Rhizobium sp. LCM 4573]TKT66932.1 LysE family translocator [Rhizobiaceae bacterium LC148]